MKQWGVNIAKAQKFLNEVYSDNIFLIEPKDSETLEVFVNELIDKDLSNCREEVLNTFILGSCKVYIYSTEKGKEYTHQLKEIVNALSFTSEVKEV